MNINISDIVKIEGASLDVVFQEKIEELNSVENTIEFNSPVVFTGSFTNIGGVLRLNGKLSVDYVTNCYRCLKDINSELQAVVKEDFIESTKAADHDEAYTYEGNFVSIDKVLKDNIVLNIPMKQICNEACMGLCPVCGNDRNEKACQCKEETMNPKLEVLKNFFNSDD